jgi:predicted phage tail protein
MKKVILEGVLGEKFGRDWLLDIRTPAESIRAIEANRRGFCKFLGESHKDGIHYQILLDEEEIEPVRLLGPFSDRETFRIVPVIEGASRGALKTIVGFVLIVAGFALAAPSGGGSLSMSEAGFTVIGFEVTAGMITLAGVALVLSGISASMLEIPDASSGEQKPSYLFAGPVNTISQGGPVPIGYGRLMVGSILVSGGVTVDEVPIGD